MTNANSYMTNGEAEEFLNEFAQERTVWMQNYGRWASEAWDGFRDDVRQLMPLLEELGNLLDEDPPDPEDSKSCTDFIDEIHRGVRHSPIIAMLNDAGLLVEVLEALRAMEGAVNPDEEDYPEEGVIESHEGLADDFAHAPTVIYDHSAQGWDCYEGAEVRRTEDGRYIGWWWRHPYAGSARCERDLFFLIDYDEEE